ncbi:MAG: hypothetical protein WCA77_09770 [Thermoplasmata archaeon]
MFLAAECREELLTFQVGLDRRDVGRGPYAECDVVGDHFLLHFDRSATHAGVIGLDDPHREIAPPIAGIVRTLDEAWEAKSHQESIVEPTAGPYVAHFDTDVT